MKPCSIPQKLFEHLKNDLKDPQDHHAVKIWMDKYSESISKWTLGSIASQLCQENMKRLHPQYSSPAESEKLYKEYLQKTSTTEDDVHVMFEMAKSTKLSPTLLARIILEHFYKDEPKSKQLVTSAMKNPYQLNDERLANEIWFITVTDNNYGSVSDVIKSQVGWEFEEYLKMKLQELNISFVDEDQLRSAGYDKTPDIKLQVIK